MTRNADMLEASFNVIKTFFVNEHEGNGVILMTNDPDATITFQTEE